MPQLRNIRERELKVGNTFAKDVVSGGRRIEAKILQVTKEEDGIRLVLDRKIHQRGFERKSALLDRAKSKVLYEGCYCTEVEIIYWRENQ